MLGFLLCDGSLHPHPPTMHPILQLTSIDQEPIQTLRRILSSNHAIITHEPDRPSLSTSYKLSIGGLTHLADRLLELGMEHYKKDRWIPDIPPPLRGDILRGVFDADGCISRKKRTQCQFRGPKRIMHWTRALLSENGIHGCYSTSPGKTTEHHRLVYASKETAEIKRIMYASSGTHIKRKCL